MFGSSLPRPARPVRGRESPAFLGNVRVSWCGVCEHAPPSSLADADPILTLFRENQRQYRELLKGMQASVARERPVWWGLRNWMQASCAWTARAWVMGAWLCVAWARWLPSPAEESSL